MALSPHGLSRLALGAERGEGWEPLEFYFLIFLLNTFC